MAETSFSSTELIKKGWGAVKSNAKILLIVLGAYILISVVTSVIQATSSVLRPFISLVSTVIQTILEIGFIKIALDIVDGKKPDPADLYKNYNLFFRFFFTSLLYGIIVILGFILLIVPGIYLAVKYQFTPYIVVDKKIAYLAAMKEAAKLTSGRWMSIFLFDLTLIGLNILGALALGIGLLITIPTSVLASSYLYRKLS